VLSYHLVEVPIRNMRLFSWRIDTRRLLLAVPAGAVVAVAAIVVATTLPAPVPGTTLPSSALSALSASSLSATPTASPSAASATPTVAAPKTSAAAADLAIPKLPPAGLTGSHQVRVLLLGDSMALTLGVGLEQDAGAWGVHVINAGVTGCDLDWTQTIQFQDDPSSIAAQGCKNWPTIWGRAIRVFHPDVVAILVGRFEQQNRLMNGHWYTVGQAPWDQLITSLMKQAIQLVSSNGAKVAMLTMPYVTQTTEAPDGQPWDINQPSRTNAWNADVRRAAAAFPGTASVVDLNQMIDPGGKYTSYLDGLRVRLDDNEHFSPAGGLYLRRMLLPAFVAVGGQRALSRPG
jgi:hypothetical protein